MKDTGIKFETLHRGFNFKKIFIGLVVIVAIGSVIILKGSKANYTYQEIIPFAEGEVRIRKADLNLMAVNIQKEKDCTTKNIDCYKTSTEVPANGYKVNTTNSYCTVDNGTKDEIAKDIPMEYKDGKVYIGVNKKGTRCYIYLDIKEYNCAGPACETIMANKTILTRTDFTNTVTDTTTGKIYKSADNSQYDDFGEVYYFAGAPTDNWVKFGQDKTKSQAIWWRIIRINGDGSIRMIYAGTGNSAPDTTGSGTQINDSTAFNSNYKDNTYVGYMYGSEKATDWASAHSNSSNSTIKQALDDWYNNASNLETLSTKLSDSVGFCGDRSSSTSKTGTPAKEGGYGTTQSYYGARYRNETKKTPSFKCTYANNDLYTTKADQIKKGNQKLQYPIGLITADEVAFAGGVYNTSNTSYYLYNGKTYWTMSPYYFSGAYAYVFYVDSSSGLSSSSVSGSDGVRPVINLKADVNFTGSGTTSSPYTVS